MREGRYLLDLGQLLGGSGSERLLKEACGRVDKERRRKALCMKCPGARAASLGAGLVIQKVLADYLSGRMTGGPGPAGQCGSAEMPGADGQGVQTALQCFSVEELLQDVGPNVIEPCYSYGPNGKPYLSDYPFRFNLSHSGAYVLCGVSGREIGVDIQKIQETDALRLAKRFFAPGEYQALKDCKDERKRLQLFFRMWTRKEAYGKLTGQGLPGAVGKELWEGVLTGGELLPEAPDRERHCPEALGKGEALPEGAGKDYVRGDGPLAGALVWEEYAVPTGYRIAVCRSAYEAGGWQ